MADERQGKGCSSALPKGSAQAQPERITFALKGRESEAEHHKRISVRVPSMRPQESWKSTGIHRSNRA